MMQAIGTDNAPPSTENLHRVIAKVSRELVSDGPITMRFWDKVRSKELETPDRSGTSSASLNSLCETLEKMRLRGTQLAVEAALIPGKT
jgi:hypothetical protein